MTLHQPQLNRRALLARSAAVAALAGYAQGGLRPAMAQTPAGEYDVTDVVTANTTFALDLYRELRQGAEGNVFFSPYSISLALAMTLAGASGETAAQMTKTLGFDSEAAAVHEALGALTGDLVTRGNADPAEHEGERGLRIANALWGEQSYPFNPAFMDEIEEHYGAGLELVDFRNSPDAAREDINAWVEEQTEDRIQDIVPPGAISGMTRLVLANAIYFYGTWIHTFDEGSTEDDAFYLLDGTTVSAPFMRQQERFLYAAGEGIQAIELPYESEGMAMTILLPDEGELEAVEDELGVEMLQGVIDEMASTEMRLFLPRFEFEFAESVAGTLQALGMTDAFDPDAADFSGMVEGDPDQPLVIGDVLHKAFVSVDEEGTEAAAATAVIMDTTSAPAPEEPIEVRVDRPFLFMIRDTETGTILFLGQVMDPTQGS